MAGPASSLLFLAADVLALSTQALQFETTDQRFHFLNLHKYGREGPKFMTASGSRVSG